MTVSQLPNGRQQFSNADGLLVNGTVYTYIPGTTTFATTYSDSAGTVPNTNPIVLDGLGSASIWGSGAYRQVVYDNLGNLVWDQVVISPSSAPVGVFTPGTAIASGTLWTNTYAYTMAINVYGGTVSQIQVDGATTGATSGTFIVPPNHTIKVTWTVAPTIIYQGIS